ncbi:hypothetical protein F5Y10DRAFT_193594 [Nemania abortiva]|nr:hypothetical protein F5Y10DRAFT_193594 [Nemania abortiva]
MPVPFRIPVPIRGDGSSYGLEALPILVSRQGNPPPPDTQGDDNNGGNQSTLIVVIVLVVGVLVFTLGGFVFLKRRAESRRRYQRANNPESYDNSSSAREGRRRVGSASANGVPEIRNSTASNIDRNTSIRSILTLPGYTKTAGPNESVLGRAGERDGVDVILEMSTEEQHEALRDEEMETMYQIRETRRQQNAGREERRRLVQEARERGDTVALEELRARRRAENEDTTIEELRETQGRIRERRDRAVSSVSYHDIGVARLDGSRIRANSTESERVGLLSDAASISISTRSASAMSTNRRVSDIGSLALDTRSPSAQSHRRMRSTSSVLSLNDNGEVSPRSGTTTPRLGGYHTRAGSSPEIVTEADLGDSDMPPPDYEDLSLDDARSGATTPMLFHEPPPDYSGHSRRTNESESESGDLASPADDERSRRSSHRSSRGVGGAPQLPSLRIRELPQIVIEPSTAHPSESGR